MERVSGAPLSLSRAVFMFGATVFTFGAVVRALRLRSSSAGTGRITVLRDVSIGRPSQTACPAERPTATCQPLGEPHGVAGPDHQAPGFTEFQLVFDTDSRSPLPRSKERRPLPDLLRWPKGASASESIPHATNRLHDVVAQFFAEVCHVDLDHVGLRFVIVSPHLIQELRLRQDLSPVTHERLE